VDTQRTEAKAVPAESEAKEKSSKKRVLPESESEPRRSKRQTVRHNYLDLHDPEPEWAHLEYENGYTEEELTGINDILSGINEDRGTSDPKTLQEA
jgi:hypothetical protein